MRTLSSRSIQDAVVFEDRHLLVLEKESGLLSQPGLGPSQYDSLIIRSQKYWPSARIVHRLDRDTSGLIVLALDSDTHRELSHQFSERIIKKFIVHKLPGRQAKLKVLSRHLFGENRLNHQSIVLILKRANPLSLSGW